MAHDRIELGKLLRTVMAEAYAKELVKNPHAEDYTNNVYFQAPSQLQYPCVIYERSKMDSQFADDNPYIVNKRYTITVIDRNPDSMIPDIIAQLPQCISDRHFVSTNLHHDVFMMYY